MNVKKGKEIQFSTSNEVGILAKVTQAVSGSGVNITALCAYGMEDKGYFMLVTSDNPKAMEAVKSLNYAPEEKDVLLVTLPNQPGAAAQVSKKLGDAGVNVKYVYATASGGNSALVVIAADDTDKALKALS